MAYATFDEWKKARGSSSVESRPAEQQPVTRAATYDEWKAKRQRELQINRIVNDRGYTSAQNWQTGANDLLREYSEFSSNWSGDPQAYAEYRRRMEAYSKQFDSILSGVGDDSEAKDSISTTQLYLRRAMEGITPTRDFWAQFGSQDEVDAAVQYARDLEELDLEAAWAELDALKQERDAFAQGAAGNWASGRLSSLFSGNNRGQNVSLDDFANMSFGDMRGYIDDVNASHGIGDAKLRDYDRRITERQQYLTQIERARSLTDMEAVVGNADFAENSAYTGNRAAGSAEAYRTYRYINDPEYRENYANARYANPNNVYSRTASAAATVLEPEEYESIDQMNEDEIAVFNYYYNTQGEEAAMQYLNALTPTIRQRRAAERFAELQGRTGAELAFGVAAGLDQFGSGLRGLVSREEQSPSWRQYTSSMVREDLEDNRISRNSNAENSIGQVAYDAITSGANMLPSILASSLVGLVNPVAGQVTGAALMGASASGNAYQEMLNLGYDKGQARAYSLLVGGSEAALSSILGGITKLGGALPSGITNALLQNVDNAVKRVAIQLGSNVVSEFSEEYLQEVISAVLQNEILRAGNDLSQVTSDALYSGLLGALTAVGFEGGGTITGAVQTRNTGKQFLESEAKLSDLHALASMMPDVESVQNLAPRVNENSNAYTVGRFYEEVTGAMGEQNKADLAAVRRDVLAELETAGITGTDANTIAKAVEAEITGKKLTESQQRLIARVGQSVPRIGEIIERGVNSDRADAGIARSLVHSKIAREMSTEPQKPSEAPAATERQAPPTTQAAQQNVSQANSADTSTTIAEAAKNTGVTEAALSRVYAMGGENQSEEAFSAAAEEVVNFAEESTLPAEEVLSYVNTLSSASVLTQGQRSALVDIGRDSIRLAYNIGYAGQNINDALENKRLARYDETEITAAYNKGAEAYKAKTGSMPQAATEAKTRKSGTVRFEGDAQEFLRKFNKAQRSAYRIMSRLAEITGVNVVLYESAADTQGRYSGVQGSFDPKDPNTVRVDINAGLSGEADIGKLAEYTMLRTFTHEFVHSFEINAPRQYAELKRVVFEQMRQNGKDVTDLIERKIVEYGTDKNGNDLLSYDDASHEVLAESLTEVLPQSQFVETLVTKHRSIFDKIYEALKRFVALIKARFAEMNQGTMKAEAKALMQEMDGVLQYTQNIVDAFDKAALAAVETVQSRNADVSDTVSNAEAFSDSSIAIRSQIRPPYNENTKSFTEFANGLNAEARKTFDLFYNFYNLSRITNTTNAAGRPVKAINISAPFLRVDEWNAKIASDAKWGAAAAKLAESLPKSVRENMHMNEDGSLTETPLEKEFKMQRSLAQRLVDSLPLEKIDAVYNIDGREVELPAGKARQSVGGEAYRRAVIGEVRKLFHDGRLKQVSIGTLSKDRWGSLGFLAANGKTGASGDFTTICPQMMFNRGCFYCYRRAALESGINNKLVAERVWYAGDILRIKQKDIDALNENGGLRIQSFGDWMPHFSAMLADVIHDAELRGLQVKIITKEPSMIQYVAALCDQGLGSNLYFNLSADYVMEKAPPPANTSGSESLDHVNPDRPFMRDEDNQMWWKRAMSVQEAAEYRAKYQWVNTRIVATDTEEFIRGLKDPTVDVVTGYHGNIRKYYRTDSETGERKVEVEALGDSGMPRFAFENGEWVTEYEGKTTTHKQLAQRIREEGLFTEYYAKVCCQTGRCATCKGKCGQMARSFAMKNATNRYSNSVAYWQDHMTSTVENSTKATPEVENLIEEFRQRMQNLSRNNENPTGKVRYQARNVAGNSVVWIEDNLLKENIGEPEHSFVADYIAKHIGEMYTIIESGQKVFLGKELPSEYTQSNYTKAILQRNRNLVKAKNRASGSLGEMIEIATNRRWEQTKHAKSKDAKYGMYRYDTRFGFPLYDPKGNKVGANVYTAELVIRNASDGKKYLYDVVSIKKDTVSSDWLSKKIASAADYAAGQKDNVDNQTIPQTEPNVNPTRSQRRENLTDREVLERAAKLFRETLGDSITGAERTSVLTEVYGQNFTEAQLDLLNIFSERLAKLKDLQAQRREQGQLYYRYTQDKDHSKRNRDEAIKAKNRMELLDRQILAAGQKVREAEGARAYSDLLQNARAIVEQTEQGRIKAALERYRDRQDNSAAIRKYRSRILTDVETLTGWLMKPDNKSVVKHIPEALRGSVVPFLQSIDFTSKRQLSGGAATKADAEFMKRLNALRDVMKEYAPDANTYEGYADLPTDFMERLDKLVQEAYDLTSSGGETFVINRMTSAELHELSYLVKRVKKFVQDFNVFHNNSMFKHVYDAGENSIGALAKMTDAGREANSVNDFLQWQQILPAYAWERFGDGGVSIFRELMRAQDQLGFNAKRIIDFSEKAFTKKEIDAWRKQIVEIKLKSGETMSIPASYLMGLYELSKREAGLRHILGNGIKTGKWKEGKNDGGKSFEIAQEDLDTMFKNLSERQKQVADALQTFMQSVCADWGNYVTMARFGEKQFGDPHYYPIVSDSNNRDAKSDEAPQATGLYRLLNMGFTKQLNEKANDRIMLYDIFDVFANHAADMAQYNAFALPVVDALKWFNYKQKDAAGKMTDSVREQMDRVYGVPKSGRGYAQAFVTGVLQAINGTETQGSKYDAPSLKMLGLYNRSQVAYNARVVIQQPTAIVRAALVLDPNSVLRALTVKNLKKNMQEMQEHSGIAVWKDLGFYDVNISRNLTGMILQDKNFGDKFVEAGMAGAEAADKLTWSWMWAACKEEVIAKQKMKPGDDGFFEAVSAKFDEVIYKTQVVDSVLTKNAYMRDKGATAKTLSSFMSESVRNASMVMDAAERLNRAKRSGMSDQEVWKKHGKYFGRAVVVYCVGNILNAFAQSIPDMVRDDDEYEKLWEKFLDAFGSNIVQNLNPLNIVPLVSNIWDAVKGLLADVAKAGGKDTNLYSYQPETIFGQWYDALSGGFIELVKRLNGDTNYTWWGTVGKLLKGISALSGMPLGNIYRTVVNTWNITAGLISPSLRIKSYDPGEKAEIKYAYLDGYLTEEEASELLMQIVDEDGESMSADDAYWVIREWDGGEDYSRFGGLYEAVLGGKDLDPAMEELLAHGYTEKDLLSEAKSEIGRAFRDGEITREKAEELLGKYFDMTDEQVSSLVNEWRAAAETDIAYGDIGTSFLAGDITRAKATEMYMEYGGKTEEEAEEIMNHLQFEQDTGHAWEDLEDLFVDGTISANSAEQYLMEYGGAYRLDAQTTVRQWECEKETGIKYSDIRSLYVSGDLTAQRAQNLRVEYGGASLDDARKLILTWKCEIDNGVRYEDIGAAFLSGDITRSEAIEWQMTYGEKDEDEADLYVTAYEWRSENPEYGDLSDSAIGRYIEHCEPAGVPAGLFYEARHFCSDIESDGTNGNVKDQYIDYIKSLPVSFEQQNALWLALKNTTWSDSGTPFS